MPITTSRVQKLVKASKGVAATPTAAYSPPLGAVPVAAPAPPLTHTILSAIDALRLTTAFGCTLFNPGGRFDAAAVEQALGALVAELPALGGRLVPPKLALGLGSASIAHTNEGALLVIADELGRQLEQCGPGSWPQRVSDAPSLLWLMLQAAPW